MASIRKRNGRYQAQIRLPGKPALSKTFSYKQDAQRWARDTERRLEQGELYAPTEGIRFQELIDRYELSHLPLLKSTKQEKSLARRVSARLGKTKSIWYLPTDRTLFYDLATDPDELAPSQEGTQVMLFDRLYLEYEEMKASEQARAASFTEEQLKGLQAIGYLQGVDSTEELESNSETEAGRGLNNSPEPEEAEQR